MRKIINGKHLLTILDSVKDYSVPEHDFDLSEADMLKYKGRTNVQSVVCSINAKDLASLVNEYNNSDQGRNILFGQNLRDALTKSSKTYEGIKQTIIEEPKNFWYYNNGITIIAKEIQIKNQKIILRNFSIINGAQTSSSFDLYQKEVHRDYKGQERNKLLKKLKSVNVLARIVETSDDKEFLEKITLFNNTQNPISTRDMVSKNEEQKKLKLKLEQNEPKIYLDIRRGVTIPNHLQLLKHRKISNTELAQYIFSGPLQNPFNAKDKKNSIYNKVKTGSYIMNEAYDKIFHPETGEAFSLNQNEIDELLFVKDIHKSAKKINLDEYKTRIQATRKKSKSATNKGNLQLDKSLQRLTKLKQINNVNTFYNIALYYKFKDKFDTYYELGPNEI